MQPPLKLLHPSSSLNVVKITQLERISAEALCLSLKPGQEHCLKTRPDGTILDGHHRIHVLQQRGIDVNSLPREIIVKDSE
jgi:hypothetical protein